MANNVLVIGGQGRIGYSVATDIATYTDARVTVTARKQTEKLEERFQFLALDLDDREGLKRAIGNSDLVVHCAGPFHRRDGRVLEACIEKKVNYIDVSDHRSFYQKVISRRDAATSAGITAVLNTGVFPGISNSMVRQGADQLDRVEKIHLSYVVAGSGGAGVTVMRTTFLGLKDPFDAWIDGRWQKVKPYTEREEIEFPQPYGKTGVYWFDMPETYTFAESFPAATVITKFGSVPDFYNHLTWIAANIFPPPVVQSPQGIEFFSTVSYGMTSVTDKFTGIGVAMRSEIVGQKNGRKVRCLSTMTHKNTAVAAGCGTGSVAELILAGKLHKPGIWAVEQALPTNLFEEIMDTRGIKIDRQLLT